MQQPAPWKSAPLITRGGLGEQCPLPGGGHGTASPLNAKQRVLKEEVANEIGRGGERDAQDCRLRGCGQIAAGNFNAYKNCVSWEVVAAACAVCKRIGYKAAASVHVAAKLGEAP